MFNYIACPLMFVKRNLAHHKWDLMAVLVWRMYEPIFHLVISIEITVWGRVLGDDRHPMSPMLMDVSQLTLVLL